ncbi:MAG: hypothetical protein IPJ84_10960 [Bdellovibrionales bacterium]|nr:hypothetical protein [Bdellovibrionales bacterium]
MALDRFRGPNGISQMIALIESATPERRSALLRSLNLENPGLASLIKTKVLTIDKVLEWETGAMASLLKAFSHDDCLNLLLLSGRSPHLSPRLKAAWELAFSEQPKAVFNTNQLRNADVIEMNLVHRIRELERLGLFKLVDVDPARAA